MALDSIDPLEEQASQVVLLLEKHRQRLVLAESCTAGLVAATLGRIPGVSQFLCGSAVVYREKTKIDWLRVDQQLIADHTAVSVETSIAISRGTLHNTPEATISLGITGHLGPGCSDEVDGKIYIACWQRRNEEIGLVGTKSWLLSSLNRAARQQEATQLALSSLNSWLTSMQT